VFTDVLGAVSLAAFAGGTCTHGVDALLVDVLYVLARAEYGTGQGHAEAAGCFPV